MRKMRSLLARFFDKVEENGASSCWPWLATKDKAGYGYFNIRNAERCRNIRAHRLSWILHNSQDIPSGEDHSERRARNSRGPTKLPENCCGVRAWS